MLGSCKPSLHPSRLAALSPPRQPSWNGAPRRATGHGEEGTTCGPGGPRRRSKPARALLAARKACGTRRLGAAMPRPEGHSHAWPRAGRKQTDPRRGKGRRRGGGEGKGRAGGGEDLAPTLPAPSPYRPHPTASLGRKGFHPTAPTVSGAPQSTRLSVSPPPASKRPT